MRVLFLSLETLPGSKRDIVTYNFIVKEMFALKKRGINVVFLSFNDVCRDLDGISVVPASSFVEKNIFLRKLRDIIFLFGNITYYGQFFLLDWRKTLWQARSDRAVLGCVKSIDIDIIHTHFFVPDGGGSIVCKKYISTPIIATCRGAEICYMPEFSYGALQCRYYKRALCSSLTSFQTITVPNKYYKNKLLRVFPFVDANNIRVVYNGVENISGFKSEHKENTVLFMCIGNLIPLKNYKILFDVVDLMRDEFKFKIKLIGNGILKDEISKKISNGYGEYISLCNEMSKENLYCLLCRADCLVHPSYAEGGANVVLEALSLGVPCIVSDIPSMQKEIIIDGVNGFLFDPDCAEQLAERMKYVIKNREVIHAMALGCRKSISSYTIENKIDSYLDIYNEALVGDDR